MEFNEFLREATALLGLQWRPFHRKGIITPQILPSLRQCPHKLASFKLIILIKDFINYHLANSPTDFLTFNKL